MRLALSVLLIGAALGAPLTAQGQERPADSVPASAKPPAGMCRIWLPNVPANKQAAPTDCPTAVRNRPANARVLFGDPLPNRGSAKPAATPPVTPLAPPKDPPKKPKKTTTPPPPPSDHSKR